MSRRKTERLLSLVVCLLSSQRYLTATQIRAAVPGYPDSFEAFKRMFERDKEELRELGIPLDTGTNGPLDEELGYRIPRQEYMLPDIRLEPDEGFRIDLDQIRQAVTPKTKLVIINSPHNPTGQLAPAAGRPWSAWSAQASWPG